MEASVQAQCERYGGGQQIKRAFVILRKPGCAPEKKGAFLTEDYLYKFVRECIAYFPPEVSITVCRLTWCDDLWVDCGRDMIAIDDAMKPRRRRAGIEGLGADRENLVDYDCPVVG